MITSPTPGTFVISLHFKGRDKPILEMDLKIDDLLEKQKDNNNILDLEYVQLNVPKTLQLLNKVRDRWVFIGVISFCGWVEMESLTVDLYVLFLLAVLQREEIVMSSATCD